MDSVRLTAIDAHYHEQVAAYAAKLATLISDLRACPGFDQRWISIGATDLQTGLMALRRAIERPEIF